MAYNVLQHTPTYYQINNNNNNILYSPVRSITPITNSDELSKLIRDMTVSASTSNALSNQNTGSSTLIPGSVVTTFSPYPLLPSSVSSYALAPPAGTTFIKNGMYAQNIYSPNAYAVQNVYDPYTYGASVFLPGPVTVPQYADLNKNEEVRRRMTKYFMYKTLDKWLCDEISDVLNYFKVSGSNVDIIHKLSDFNDKHVHTQKECDEIISYIENNVLTYSTMYKILSKFTEKTKTNWYDLTKNEMFLVEYVKKQLVDIVTNMINQKKK